MMKRLYFLIAFVCMGLGAFSQSDTLITKRSEKIPCKITEIGEDEIKYKKADNLEGPVYSLSKNKIREMIFSNGTKEYVTQDEMALDAKSTPELLNETRSFKIEPFSPFMNHICLGYEQMLKVGTNLEVKLGYIYGGLNTNFRSPYYSYSTSYRATPVYGIGGYVKGGVKFLLGQDFVTRGLRYAHPLKGRFVRFDVDVVTIKYNGVSRYNYTGPYSAPQVVSTDISASSYGLFLSYGRQWVLGDILTLDYYLGIGAAGQTTKYSNPGYTSSGYYRESNVNYYAHTMMGATFAGTFGLSIGYIAKGPVKPTRNQTPNTPRTR